MGKKTTDEITSLKEVVSKLIRTKQFNKLTDSDISLLSEFANIELTCENLENRKTLLSWFWDSALKYDRYIEHGIFTLSYLHEAFLPDLKVDSYEPLSGEAMCTLFTRNELINIIRETLLLKENVDRENCSKIRGAILLAGLAGFNEFEKDIIRERVRAGLENARKKGKRLGRRPVLTGFVKDQVKTLKSEGLSNRKVAKKLGICDGSVRTALRMS